MRPEWKVVQRPVYETPWWRLYDDVVIRPGGTETTYVWARTTSGRGAVMCIPRTQDGRILLIRVYRHPVRREEWEFVAGLVDEGETPEQASSREVEEEVGVRPLEVKVFPSYTPISGFVGDEFYAAVATIPDVDLEDLRLQADEGITGAMFVTDLELTEMVRDGRIRDGVTMIAVAHYWASERLK